MIPTKEDEKYLGEIIEELSKKHRAPVFIPHITIYGDITIDLEKLRGIAENSVKSLSPFTVYAGKVNHSGVFL